MQPQLVNFREKNGDASMIIYLESFLLSACRQKARFCHDVACDDIAVFQLLYSGLSASTPCTRYSSSFAAVTP